MKQEAGEKSRQKAERRGRQETEAEAEAEAETEQRGPVNTINMQLNQA